MLAPREKLWPASLPIVRKALSLLNLTPNDRLADYGCGNGIALFTAVSEFQLQHVYGYEIFEPRAIELINEIKEKQLENKITIKIQNALEADPTEPTAVYLYLISRGLELLLPLLRSIAAHRPSTQLRVVTVLYKIPHIPYDKMEKVYTSDIAMTPIYLYTITPMTGLSSSSSSSSLSSSSSACTNVEATSEKRSSSSSNSATEDRTEPRNVPLSDEGSDSLTTGKEETTDNNTLQEKKTLLTMEEG